MQIKMFYHSLTSDWNHGNAHFLRGIVTELLHRGHHVQVYEPRNSWSLQNLLKDAGPEILESFRKYYPNLSSIAYDLNTVDLNNILSDADLVLVHEWNEPQLVREIGRHRSCHPRYLLFFHDTHHRAATHRSDMADYDLRFYDGVLAFGNIIRDLYLAEGWCRRAWTWHEAADTRVFSPVCPSDEKEGDLVWIGNWGDEERTEELIEFLFNPIEKLNLRAQVYGVRYPEKALEYLQKKNISYRGYLANFLVPQTLSRFHFTVHIPRRPYVENLPGIPTIRPFEVMASGIPLICSPWEDSEKLFTPGEDYLIARTGAEMMQYMKILLHTPLLREKLAQHARRTIVTRHTCAHRVNELASICAEAGLDMGYEAVLSRTPR